MDTLSYWLARLKPLLAIDKPREVIIVLANRAGIEGDAVYAGTSAIIGIERGYVKLYGVLRRGEKELLMVDTSKPREKLLFTSFLTSFHPSLRFDRKTWRLPILSIWAMPN
jgi:protein N-terminal amidase